MTESEIPEEALSAMWGAFWGPDSVVVMDGKGARQMRRLLEAALPHLRVQETPALELAESARAIAARLRIDLESVDREDTRIALGNSARDVIRLAELIEAPHPRSAVDREALRATMKYWLGNGETDDFIDDATAAVLALLPTEEGEVYYCPMAREVERYPGGGFDVCCEQPDLHIPLTFDRIEQAVLAMYAEEFETPMCEEIGCVLRLDHARQHIDEDGNAWPLPTEEATRALVETGTRLGYELGRKEAGEEIYAALKKRRDEVRADEQRGWPLLTEAAVIARDLTSQPSGAASEPRTAHPAPPEQPLWQVSGGDPVKRLGTTDGVAWGLGAPLDPAVAPWWVRNPNEGMSGLPGDGE